MAVDFSHMNKTVDPNPPIITIYGGEGLGKTSFAAEAPNPLYVKTGKNERPPSDIEMACFGLCETFEDVMNNADWMLDPEVNEDRLTYVLDTLDSLDAIIEAEACARNGWKDITEGTFGNGKIAKSNIWHEFLNKMADLKASGFLVILIAHCKAKTDPGITTDSFPSWRLNIRNDDDGNAIAHVSDIVGFVHRRPTIVKEKAGFHKDNVRVRADGGADIQIAVQGRPNYIAKNRYGIKSVIGFKPGSGYSEISKHFPAPWAHDEQAAA